MLKKISGNPNFARSLFDQIAVGIFIFGAHLAIWYEVWVVMPYYHGDVDDFRYVHYLAVAVIYINTFGNLVRVVTRKLASPYLELSDQTKACNWEYCSKCLAYAPPRSHHCPVCNICVMKRDHHCWFAGVCIGWANQRHFIPMIFWAWIAAVYGNVYHYQFATAKLGTGFGTLFCIIAPHVAGLLGYLSLSEFFISILTFVALLLLIMFTWMLQIQSFQVFYGQTKFERKYGNRDYDLGWKENIIEVLGDRWYLVWLFPWIPSKVPGDGVSFRHSAKSM